MKRRLLAALAGCLALPALGWAQSDGFTIPNAPIYPTARPTRPISLAPASPRLESVHVNAVKTLNVSPASAREAPDLLGDYRTTFKTVGISPSPAPQPASPRIESVHVNAVKTLNVSPAPPLRSASPYHAQPLLPPNEPPPLRYPSQETSFPLPVGPTPPLGASSLGLPQPFPSQPPSNASTSFKNAGEVRLEFAPENKSSTPALGFSEAVPIPVTSQDLKSVPSMDPNGGPSAPIVGEAREIIPGTVPVVPTGLPTSGNYTVPTLAPTSYPGTRAEAIISTPTMAAFGSCDTCEPTGCGPDGRAWVGAEYLYWKAKAANAPPLASTSPVGTPIANAGVLGTPGARSIFGGDLNDQWRSGVRVRAGYWVNSSQTFGFEAGGFYLGQDATDFRASSPGMPILSRPFVDATTGLPVAELVAFPGVLSGTVRVSSGSNLHGFDPAARINLCCDCDSRLDLLLGYRYLRLRDGVTIREELLATDPAGVRAPFGTQITVVDTFNTINTFNGAQIGLAGERRFGDFILGGRATVSGGNTHQQVTINGMTQIRPPGGAPTNLVGGLLAQRTNIGTSSVDQFSIVPEVGVNLGYQVSSNLRVFGGYNFLYWTNVVRAAEQIDLGVNPTGIPRAVPPSALQGAPRPAFFNRDNDYWLHGVSAGIELRF
jgi:hypothetical protein